MGAVVLYVPCLDYLLSDMEFDGDAFQCHFGNAEMQFDAHSLSSPSPHLPPSASMQPCLEW